MKASGKNSQSAPKPGPRNDMTKAVAFWEVRNGSYDESQKIDLVVERLRKIVCPS